MHSKNIFQEEDTAIIPLPPRNDTEAEIVSEFKFPSGELFFEGQIFLFPEGCDSKVTAKWLEENLLSVNISVNARITAECARCLKPVELEISESLDYLYYSKNDETLEDDAQFMPVEIDFFSRTLDVMPQIAESVFTLLPFKVLCKEDCKGLCQNCGADLNEGDCSCQSEIIDPRFESLKNLALD